MVGETDVPQDPILEILEELAPAHLHAAGWATCMGNGWAFGHGSRAGGSARFWKLDLANSAAFDEIWRHAQPQCEALAGAPLQVISQYANGHTFGLGGEAHIDTSLPGSFTLLYYVNPVWENGWDGETVFYDGAGEVALAVRPRPNRAVFFDSRILHNGRAPSRFCTELRVTVAYKLQISPVPVASVAGSVASVKLPEESQPPARLEEISRDGAARVYAARIGQSVIEVEIEGRLKKMGETVRLPGFRPGKIPREELVRRYGLAARAEALKHLAAKLVEQSMPPGTVAGSCELKAGAEGGDMELQIHATYLPDLPDPDFTQIVIERLSSASESPEVLSFLRNHFKAQVLDKLDSSYSIPLFRGVIEREFTAIAAVAKSRTDFPTSADEQQALLAELAKVAERRLRLGLIVAEMARRLGMRAGHPAELEEKVVDRLAAQARVSDRQLTTEELHRLMEE